MARPLFIAPFPAESLRSKIGPDDWQACLQAWTLFVNGHLTLSDQEFATLAGSTTNVSSFLTSYCRETTGSPRNVAQLHGLVFRLAVRTLRLSEPPPPILHFSFLSDLCSTFGPSPVLEDLLQDVWQRKRLEASTDFIKHKTTFIRGASSPSSRPDLDQILRHMSLLIRACPEYGRFLLAGSEFVDALVLLWSLAPSSSRRKATEVSFLAMRSLVLEPRPNASALLDQLYDLKAAAENDKNGKQAQFLRQLVSISAILNVLKRRLGEATRTRAQPLISYLSTLDDGTMARRRQVREGKRPQKASFGHGAVGDVHMHRMGSITQIQELFPDLGAGFVLKLLDHYQDNVEQVTACLLEDSLPAHLSSTERSEPLPGANTPKAMQDHLEPRPTPPMLPQRRNVYDGDDFDNLALSARNLHIGKKEIPATVQPLSDKAKIYSALAAFDSDDDERDDTYDVEDVGGTVDVQGYDKDPEDAAADQNAEALFRAWKMNPATFQRDAVTRKSAARQALRSETKLTDEGIEGFAIMLQREPRRLRALEARFPDFTGEQAGIHSTRWRQEEEAGESTEGDDGGPAARGRGRGRGRGPVDRGRGRGRGNVAGPSDDKQTQIARQRKDENKAQRGNHNRRAQRAKKMARGGFAG